MRHLVIFFILGTCWTMAHSSILKDKIFIFQKPDNEINRTLLVVTWAYEGDDEQAVGCNIFTNLQLIEEVVKESNDELVRTPSEQEMADIIEECTEISRRRRRDADSFERRSVAWRRNSENSHRSSRRVNSEGGRNQNGGSDEKRRTEESTESSSELDDNEQSSPEVQNTLPVIFPGTKWCGSGDLAKNYDDLGFHQDTDRCCRAHDLCNDTLAPGETKNDLTNKSPFTKLSCTCDDDFYNCLERINSITSNTVGNMYFNLLKRECYAEDYPLTKKCKKYRTFLKLKCIEYERDTKAKKVYQWIPAKWYKKLPLPVLNVELSRDR